jgi:CP family cyanate transporter-like MFS transporter
VALGLALLAAGALLRAVWPDATALFAFTVVLSLGIALAQTAVPVLARQWFPARIGLASALFSDGLILGETLAAALTASLLARLGPLGAVTTYPWEATFVVWSVPVMVALVLWLALAPPAPALSQSRRVTAPAVSNSAAPARALGDGREGPRVRAWHLGIVLGSGSLVYFAMNGWIAPYDQALHRTGATAAALAVLNAAQLPVSLGITPFAQRVAGRRWPFIVAGGVCLAAVAGWLWGPAPLEPLWAALLGGGSAFVFVLGIALPPLLASRETVARLTGLTLTVSYGVAFLGPLVGGWLWDLSGVPGLAFLPVVVAGLLMIVLGARLPSRARFGLA